jgi:hypothetical protein
MRFKSFYEENKIIEVDSLTLEVAKSMMKDWKRFPSNLSQKEKLLFMAEILKQVEERWDKE